MALRLIFDEVVSPLDSEAVTIMSFSVMLSGCKAMAMVVSRRMVRDWCIEVYPMKEMPRE